jgi:hypothetical protein
VSRPADDLLDALAHHRRRPVGPAGRGSSFAGRLRSALAHAPAGDSWSPAPDRTPAWEPVPAQRHGRPGWARWTPAAAVAGAVLAVVVALVGKVDNAADPVSSGQVPTAEPTSAPVGPVDLARETPRSGTGYVLLPAAGSVRLDCGRPGRTATVTYALPVDRSVLTARLSAQGAGGSASVEFSVGAGRERRSVPVTPGRPADPVAYRPRGPADSLTIAVRCSGGATGVTLAAPTVTS